MLDHEQEQKVRSVKQTREPWGRIAADSLADYVEQTSRLRLHDWQKRLCARLQGMKNAPGTRLLIHAPPQYGKSLIVSKRLPSWWLGHFRTDRVVLAAYNESHAESLMESNRFLAGDPIHAAAFAGFGWARWSLGTGAFTHERSGLCDGQPSLRAVGLLSGFTGIGADLLIIDDPYASPDDARSSAVNERVWRWWNELARVRISEQTHVVVMFHRYHPDDLAGRLMTSGDWERMRFPAIADENPDLDDPTGRAPGELLSPMRSEAFLNHLRSSDPFGFAGQFMGRPLAETDGFIRASDFTESETVPRLRLWVRYFDLATSRRETGDYTAGVLLGQHADQSLHLRHVCRFRKEWPEAKEAIITQLIADAELCASEGAIYRVGLDARLSQQAFFHDLTRDPRIAGHPVLCHSIFPDRAPGDKKQRAAPWVARARLGQLFYYRTGWDVEALIAEARAFTGGETDAHDDQVDAMSGAFALLVSDPNTARAAEPTWRSLCAMRSINYDKT